jgi:hypothetical protein
MSAKPTQPLLVWIDYGSEGWHPRGFETEEQLREWILDSGNYGNPFIVTRLLDVRLTLEERTVS